MALNAEMDDVMALNAERGRGFKRQMKQTWLWTPNEDK